MTDIPTASLVERLLNEADLMAVHPQRIPDRTLEILREAAAHILALEAKLGEVDSVLYEYGIDTVGTGSRPSTKEQSRVNSIVDAATARHATTLSSQERP